MAHIPKPLALIILDGWGHREASEHNAIHSANTPNWDALWRDHPHTLLSASGHCVGLPEHQMGNSEVGHLHMGSGRVIYQELSKINQAIADDTFYANAVLCQAVDTAIADNKAVHIMGLLSAGGVHSHDSHIQAMIRLAAQRGAKAIYVHAFLDGRDTPPESAMASIEAVNTLFDELGVGRFASLIGRFYAMDRDKRWDRVEKAYQLLTCSQAEFHFEQAQQALIAAYDRGETDEFVQATRIGDAISLQDGDQVIFMNFRADRARELSSALTDTEFTHFNRPCHPNIAQLVTLTEYHADFNHPIAFPNTGLKNVLGDCLAQHQLTQLRIAETEKYAHVTFFFNGGSDAPFPGEDRLLIPSPKVETYDLQPEMSAPELTEQLVNTIHQQQHDVIICNFANADMVGHSGQFEAAVKAVEALDTALGKVWTALEQVGGEMIVTADHGNVELMYDTNKQQSHTAHTCEPVPFIYAGRPAHCTINTGTLSDIAPTILSLLDLPIPPEMAEQSVLVQLD